MRCPPAIAALLSVVIACLPSDGEGPPDSAAAENARFEGSLAAAAIASGPVLVIGGNEAAPKSQFDVIGSAAFLTDHIAIANGGSAEVFVFDGEGERVATVGGLGGGPGEFRFPMSQYILPSSGDAVIVADFHPRSPKISTFALTGEVLAEIIAPPNSRPRGATLAQAIHPAGIMFFLHQPLDQDAAPSPTRRNLAALLRFDLRTGSVEKVAELPGPDLVRVDLGPLRSFGGPPVEGMTDVKPIFGSTSELAGGGDPFRIAVGTRADPTISIFDDHGSLQQEITAPGAARTPSRRQVEMAREEFFESVEGRTAAFRFVGGAHAIKARMPIAARTPVFRSLAISATGDLWVERYPLPTDPAVHWWVYSTDGEYRGGAWVPHGRRVLSIGAEHYLAWAQDDLDVQRVEVWPVLIQ